MVGRVKLREKLSKFILDHDEFEGKAIEFIELLDQSNVPGEVKKKAVMARLQQWLDEKIALKGFWEFLSDIAIRVAMIFISSWVESIFQRWKAEKKIASIEKPAVIAESAPVVVKEKRAKKQE